MCLYLCVQCLQRQVGMTDTLELQLQVVVSSLTSVLGADQGLQEKTASGLNNEPYLQLQSEAIDNASWLHSFCGIPFCCFMRSQELSTTRSWCQCYSFGLIQDSVAEQSI